MEGRATAAVFEPVAASTAFEGTVERLGTAIKLGLLAPGDQLPPERELAARLSISRSTLRMALQALVEGGYLVAIRGRSGGTFVADEPPAAQPSPPPELAAAWRQIVDRRLAVEVGAAVLAAERARPEHLGAMRELIEQMAAAREFDEYRRADIHFHLALAEASGVPRIVADMTEVQGAMTELIRAIPHPHEVLVHANRQHTRLVDALERNETARSVRLIQEHLRGTEHILAAFFPAPDRDD
jgi:GntR family transcriptional regulator, transcriptional repressor for pyruvate dehydrogenase complex